MAVKRVRTKNTTRLVPVVKNYATLASKDGTLTIHYPRTVSYVVASITDGNVSFTGKIIHAHTAS